MTIEATLLSSELTRIGTYIGWPGQNSELNGSVQPNIIDLVKAGFYFTGSADIVRCFSCGLEIKALQHLLDPYIVHVTRNPHCVFIMSIGSGNMPGLLPSPRENHEVLSVASQHTAPVSSSLEIISDTSLSFRGESMQSPSSQSNNVCLTSASRSGFNILQGNNSSDDQQAQATTRRTHTCKCNTSAADSPPPRRSSTSEFPETNRSNFRPHIQRARSDVAERYPAKNSGIIAKRQNSSPGFNRILFQESEAARLQTFCGWTGIKVAKAREFAEAGFIYIGPADRVQCVFCAGRLQQWNSDDLPLEEHHKYFPECSFVVESMSHAAMPKPKHSKYKSVPSRLSSFQDWDPSWNPKPAVLAKAGFFYTGRADHAKCFFCSGTLCNWEPSDDPWREHARWFPKCPYVKQSKGQAYINGVLNSMNLADYQAMLLDKTSQKYLTKEQTQKNDNEKVIAWMDSPMVKAVLDLDVPKKLVKKVIMKRLAENGEDFSSTEALLEAIFNKSTSETEPGNELDTIKLGMRDDDTAGTSHSSKSKKHNLLLLAEENRLLKEQKQCKVCLDQEVSVTFIPCGHLVCCSSCASALKQCPVCRAKIKRMIRTFMS